MHWAVRLTCHSGLRRGRQAGLQRESRPCQACEKEPTCVKQPHQEHGPQRGPVLLDFPTCTLGSHVLCGGEYAGHCSLPEFLSEFLQVDKGKVKGSLSILFLKRSFKSIHLSYFLVWQNFGPPPQCTLLEKIRVSFSSHRN